MSNTSQEKQSPPITNRGVQNTSSDRRISLVDWVQATFPLWGGGELPDDADTSKIHEISAYKVAEILGYDRSDFREMDHGLNGYKRQLARGHIKILFEGNQLSMGVHVVMSGQACREYENDGKLSWPEFFRLVYEREGHMTRLDLAIDDFDKTFTPDQIEWRLDRGLVSSRFKSYRVLKKALIADGEVRGKTVYLGSEKSDIQIRIYDKKLEREENDKIVTVDSWVRTEIEMRDRRADIAAQQIVYEYFTYDDARVGSIVAGILKNYITIHAKKTEDKNKARWPRWGVWDKFLGDAEKLKLTIAAPDKTIEKKKSWVNKSLPKTLAAIFVADDGRLDWIIDLIERGGDMLDDSDINMIEQYQRNRDAIKRWAQGLHDRRYLQLLDIDREIERVRDMDLSEDDYLQIMSELLRARGEISATL